MSDNRAHALATSFGPSEFPSPGVDTTLALDAALAKHRSKWGANSPPIERTVAIDNSMSKAALSPQGAGSESSALREYAKLLDGLEKVLALDAGITGQIAASSLSRHKALATNDSLPSVPSPDKYSTTPLAGYGNVNVMSSTSATSVTSSLIAKYDSDNGTSFSALQATAASELQASLAVRPAAAVPLPHSPSALDHTGMSGSDVFSPPNGPSLVHVPIPPTPATLRGSMGDTLASSSTGSIYNGMLYTNGGRANDLDLQHPADAHMTAPLTGRLLVGKSEHVGQAVPDKGEEAGPNPVSLADSRVTVLHSSHTRAAGDPSGSIASDPVRDLPLLHAARAQAPSPLDFMPTPPPVHARRLAYVPRPLGMQHSAQVAAAAAAPTTAPGSVPRALSAGSGASVRGYSNSPQPVLSIESTATSGSVSSRRFSHLQDDYLLHSASAVQAVSPLASVKSSYDVDGRQGSAWQRSDAIGMHSPQFVLQQRSRDADRRDSPQKTDVTRETAMLSPTPAPGTMSSSGGEGRATMTMTLSLQVPFAADPPSAPASVMPIDKPMHPASSAGRRQPSPAKRSPNIAQPFPASPAHPAVPVRLHATHVSATAHMPLSSVQEVDAPASAAHFQTSSPAFRSSRASSSSPSSGRVGAATLSHSAHSQAGVGRVKEAFREVHHVTALAPPASGAPSFSLHPDPGGLVMSSAPPFPVLQATPTPVPGMGFTHSAPSAPYWPTLAPALGSVGRGREMTRGYHEKDKSPSIDSDRKVLSHSWNRGSTSSSSVLPLRERSGAANSTNQVSPPHFVPVAVDDYGLHLLPPGVPMGDMPGRGGLNIPESTSTSVGISQCSSPDLLAQAKVDGFEPDVVATLQLLSAARKDLGKLLRLRNNDGQYVGDGLDVAGEQEGRDQQDYQELSGPLLEVSSVASSSAAESPRRNEFRGDYASPRAGETGFANSASSSAWVSPTQSTATSPRTSSLRGGGGTPADDLYSSRVAAASPTAAERVGGVIPDSAVAGSFNEGIRAGSASSHREDYDAFRHVGREHGDGVRASSSSHSQLHDDISHAQMRRTTSETNTHTTVHRHVTSAEEVPSLGTLAASALAKSTLPSLLALLKIVTVYHANIVKEAREKKLSTVPSVLAKPLAESLIRATGSLRAADACIIANNTPGVLPTAMQLSVIEQAVRVASGDVVDCEAAFKAAQEHLEKHGPMKNKKGKMRIRVAKAEGGVVTVGPVPGEVTSVVEPKDEGTPKAKVEKGSIAELRRTSATNKTTTESDAKTVRSVMSRRGSRESMGSMQSEGGVSLGAASQVSMGAWAAQVEVAQEYAKVRGLVSSSRPASPGSSLSADLRKELASVLAATRGDSPTPHARTQGTVDGTDMTGIAAVDAASIHSAGTHSTSSEDEDSPPSAPHPPVTKVSASAAQDATAAAPLMSDKAHSEGYFSGLSSPATAKSSIKLADAPTSTPSAELPPPSPLGPQPGSVIQTPFGPMLMVQGPNGLMAVPMQQQSAPTVATSAPSDEPRPQPSAKRGTSVWADDDGSSQGSPAAVQATQPPAPGHVDSARGISNFRIDAGPLESVEEEDEECSTVQSGDHATSKPPLHGPLARQPSVRVGSSKGDTLGLKRADSAGGVMRRDDSDGGKNRTIAEEAARERARQKELEAELERERDRQKQRDKEREREREKEREREREKERDRERERARDREREKEREREREKERHREREKERDREREKERDRERDRRPGPGDISRSGSGGRAADRQQRPSLSMKGYGDDDPREAALKSERARAAKESDRERSRDNDRESRDRTRERDREPDRERNRDRSARDRRGSGGTSSLASDASSLDRPVKGSRDATDKPSALGKLRKYTAGSGDDVSITEFDSASQVGPNALQQHILQYGQRSTALPRQSSQGRASASSSSGQQWPSRAANPSYDGAQGMGGAHMGMAGGMQPMGMAGMGMGMGMGMGVGMGQGMMMPNQAGYAMSPMMGAAGRMQAYPGQAMMTGGMTHVPSFSLGNGRGPSFMGAVRTAVAVNKAVGVMAPAASMAPAAKSSSASASGEPGSTMKVRTKPVLKGPLPSTVMQKPEAGAFGAGTGLGVAQGGKRTPPPRRKQPMYDFPDAVSGVDDDVSTIVQSVMMGLGKR